MVKQPDKRNENNESITGQHPGDRMVRRVKALPDKASRGAAPFFTLRRVTDVPVADGEESRAAFFLRYLATIALLGLLTGALWPVRETIGLLNIGFLYLIVVIAATTFAGRRAGILASVLGFALFDFFLVPPYLTFVINQLNDLLALFVFLGVSALISWLLARAREEATQAQQHAEDLSRLYELSQAIIGVRHPDEVLPEIAGKVAGVFEAQACWILLPDGKGQLKVQAHAPKEARPPARAQLGTAQWVLENGKEVGMSSDQERGLQRGLPARFEGRQASHVSVFVPLRVAERIIGVLGVADKEGGRGFNATERTTLATFADQIAIALEQLRLLREVERAEMLDKTDKLKSVSTPT